MPFEYSTQLSSNPVSQPLISRLYDHHDTPYELPKALTKDCCLNPGSNVCTHSGRHLWQTPLRRRKVPKRSLSTASFASVIPPQPRHRRE